MSYSQQLSIIIAVNTTANACVHPGGRKSAIAHELEAKGYRTVTFDKQPEVGGKCQAYYDGPDQ